LRFEKPQLPELSMMSRLNYATALRCIGQDLERRGLKSFDIRVRGSVFVVECGYQEPPSPTPVSVEYTLKDIDELDRAGENRRGEAFRAPEFINQVQIFRTIGAYLDRNEARLVRVTNNDGKAKDSLFTVEYLTPEGDRVIDDKAGAAIYDMCVQMYKQRGKLTGTGGRRSGWRR
jgi:hypothetical protein